MHALQRETRAWAETTWVLGGTPSAVEEREGASEGYVALYGRVPPGQLNRDVLVQPLRVRLTSARLLLFLPCSEIGRITHHDQADTV